MDDTGRSPRRMPAVVACCLSVGLLAGACSNSKLKTASPVSPAATSPTTTTVAPASEPSSTAPPAGATPTTGQTPIPATVPLVTAPPVTAAKRWVIVAVFSGSGDKEGDTFTITGAPARVSYKATGPFLLNIDTGDPADDTAIGSCPTAGCNQQGAVHVVPGGWYLHVIQTPPATAYSITLEEFR
jgi:hypothetical protein